MKKAAIVIGNKVDWNRLVLGEFKDSVYEQILADFNSFEVTGTPRTGTYRCVDVDNPSLGEQDITVAWAKVLIITSEA